MLTVIPGENNDLTQIRCTCSSLCSGYSMILLFYDFLFQLFSLSCVASSHLQTTYFYFSEPLFFQIRVILEGNLFKIHTIFEPSGTIAPISYGGCQSITETYGSTLFLFLLLPCFLLSLFLPSLPLFSPPYLLVF